MRASDHADPIKLKQKEEGICGLFAFPSDDGEGLVLILTLRPNLLDDPPYRLSPYHYRINFDTESAWDDSDEDANLRYGGKVEQADQIAVTKFIEIRLKDDATLESVEFEGLGKEALRQSWSGVADDPFIQPGFFGRNVIAVALDVEIDALLGLDRDRMLIWANTFRGGRQLDHVGRANRTMQPRFDHLNTFQPHEHEQEILRRHTEPSLVEDLAKTIITPLFAMREYDVAPDVMYYDRSREVAFPNGRRLTDDVAALTNEYGESLLWQIGWGQIHGLERPDENDKKFKAEFPFLADPWAATGSPPAPSLTTASKVKIGVLGAIVLVLFVLPWILWLRLFLRQRRRSSNPA